MRVTIAVAASSSILVLASAAAAGTPGDAGDAVLSADRLFGLNFNHVSTEDPDPNEPDDELDATSIGLGWNQPAPPLGAPPHVMPRFGFDYFVIDSLSVGGALGFSSWSAEDERGNQTDLTALLLYPRVGWVFGIGNSVAFWLRGGFTYHSYNWEDSPDESGLALTAEGLFLFAPVDHFAFTVGPILELTITGSVDNPDRDRRYRVLGITTGILGWI